MLPHQSKSISSVSAAMGRPIAMRASIVAGLIAGSLPSIAEAQALRDALVAAYRNNPALQSQRFRTRASDESVARARSGYRPRVSGEAYAGVTAARRDRGGNGDGPTHGVGLSIEQPLFDGFQTHYAVAEAKSGVLASRNELKAQENEILLQAASAYFDVLRDEGILLYRRKTLNALRRELIGARQRMTHGEATVTDVEQSRQRVALAESDLETATSRLEVSRLRFARIVGRAPDDLRMPDMPTRLLPKSRRRAVETALEESPIVAAARYQHEAARHAVDKVKGELLPSAAVVGGYDRSFGARSTMRDEDDFSLVGRIRVPLYQGGEVSARVRQARQTALSRDRDVIDQRNRIGEAVGAAWSELGAARRRLGLEEKAVSAAERALGGLREEQRVGTRILTDVLDAERELVNARIRVLETRRDLHVSAFALLRAMGTLTIKAFAPEVERYEPGEHYAKANGKWWGTSTPATRTDPLLGTGQSRAVETDSPARPRRHEPGTASRDRQAAATPAWQATIRQR